MLTHTCTRARVHHCVSKRSRLRWISRLVLDTVSLRKDPVNRTLQRRCGRVLRHKRGRALLHRRRLHLRVVERRDDDDVGLWCGHLKGSADHQAVNVGQHEIDKKNVRFQRADGVIAS